MSLFNYCLLYWTWCWINVSEKVRIKRVIAQYRPHRGKQILGGLLGRLEHEQG